MLGIASLNDYIQNINYKIWADFPLPSFLSIKAIYNYFFVVYNEYF